MAELKEEPRYWGWKILAVVVSGILLFLFWRRRAKVLKTGELPELGYIRKKILAFIVEE